MRLALPGVALPPVRTLEESKMTLVGRVMIRPVFGLRSR